MLRRIIATLALASVATLTLASDGKWSLPLTVFKVEDWGFGAGLAYETPRHWTIIGQVLYQDLTRFDSSTRTKTRLLAEHHRPWHCPPPFDCFPDYPDPIIIQRTKTTRIEP